MRESVTFANKNVREISAVLARLVETIRIEVVAPLGESGIIPASGLNTSIQLGNARIDAVDDESRVARIPLL